ncbi:hypothetical protein EMB92_11340 [Bifidobacterium callitrichos]|uniref:Uncharacterized protein n=1 Tax=Bifidobacterium callitrichos TaxID=762209 RepID=A0A5M9Z8U2_9BIFI|nr:hypothetical protein [Bifidobacterium callitrichos]KAA8815080.1 hypothetical protein EMB92_11340 [Bifidobacterium callitrichos]
MKGNMKAYKPASEDREIKEIRDVFRKDDAPTDDENPLVMTSIRLHAKTRAAAKVYAIEHGMKMQEVIENALSKYIGER